MTVGGDSYTIAEAIAKKDVISQELSLTREISRQYNQAEQTVRTLEAKNEDKLDDLIRASIGKDRKTDTTEIEVDFK